MVCGTRVNTLISSFSLAVMTTGSITLRQDMCALRFAVLTLHQWTLWIRVETTLQRFSH